MVEINKFYFNYFLIIYGQAIVKIYRFHPFKSSKEFEIYI